MLENLREVFKRARAAFRHFALSSKEACFQRDMMTKEIAEFIKESRVASYNKPDNDREEFEIGGNVLLKQDKTKLKPRQPYKIVDIFEKNGENWAVIQKHDSQFRAKQYKAKFNEIVKLPGQISQKDDVEEHLEPMYQDTIEDEFAKVQSLSAKLMKIITLFNEFPNTYQHLRR